MKKARKAFLSILLVISMIFATVAPAMALTITITTDKKETEEEGPAFVALDLVLETDKDSYTVDEEIEYTITLTNNTKKHATDVRVINFLSAGLKTSDGKMTAGFADLAPGESVSKTVYVAHQTYDNYGNDGIATALNVISIVFNVFKLVIGKLFASFLPYMCNLDVDMDGQLLGMLSMAFAYEGTGEEADDNDDEKDDSTEATTYTVSFDLNYEGAENTIPSQTVKAGETAVEPDAPEREGYTFIGWYKDEECLEKHEFTDTISNKITLYAFWAVGEKEFVSREEWIIALAEVIGLTNEEYSFYSFDDSSFSSSPDTIEAAYVNRWFELDEDVDNMVYFRPTDTATREFVAVTSTNALLYDVSYLENPNWEDIGEAHFPLNDAQAVNVDILDTSNNHFNPQSPITFVETQAALQAIKTILKETEINEEAENFVNYVDGIEPTELYYSLDEENNKVYTIDSEIIADWQPGEIHVLVSADETAKDVAVKIIRITEENGYTVIIYEEPVLEEVVRSFNIEGMATSGGTFTPAEGITVVNNQPSIRRVKSSRAAISDTIDLWGATTLKIDNLDTEVTIDMQNIEYRFAASPSWHLISIDEVYLAVNCEFSADWQIEDLEYEPERVPLGNFNCPLGYGFNASIEVYLTCEAEAGFNIVFSLNSKAGIQYTKNTGVRFIKNITPNLEPIKFSGSVYSGVELEPAAEFLGIDLVSIGVGAGAGVEGELTPVSVIPPQFCFDSCIFIYLNIYARIGPESLGLEFTKDIFNSDHSIYKDDIHFEETGKKEECTRGSGNYNGSVVRADDTRIPVNNAKIQVLRGNRVVDTTISDSHGNFIGISLPSGSYRIIVSCSGYIPYERQFDIVGGETTTVPTQLMISRDNEGENGWDVRSCSGYVNNAYTGGRISGATVEIRTQHLFGDDDLIDVVTTDSNGYYSFNVTIGQYEIKVIKDGYITNSISVTVFNDVTDANVILNPENATVINGDLRTVLSWGMIPRDLDSHMVGPENNGRFHVYFSDMTSNHVKLDVDDTNGEGPETVTIYESEEGVYSYYVHDYTNRSKSDSTAMSNSGAKVQLYVGDTLMYTINIPTNTGGTVWHVFDYDSSTGLITLVNDFSYQESPQNVGR